MAGLPSTVHSPDGASYYLKCGQTDGWTDKRTKNGQTNRQNFTNFERNLAMMVIYLPVKFEFDWSNRFRVRVRKRKCGQTAGWTEKGTEKGTKEQTEFHQYRKEPSYNCDVCPCEV